MLEWEEGRTGTRIPKWNGRLLASRVDPLREAVHWADRAEARVRGVRTAFILGLGAGFHVQELAKRFSNLNIIAFEPIAELADDFNARSSAPNVTVIVPFKGALVLSEPRVADAVCASYVVLRHAPTMKCSEELLTETERWLLGRDDQSFYALLQARRNDLQLFSRLELPELRNRGLSDVRNRKPVTIKSIVPALRPAFDERSQIWLALSELVK
ncbi:MAG TPA: hypothetical protein VFV50_18750 [Bdellovibrionales bacterium]|nr:hypothetical protein [Bdellovibrionales bacterium]